MTTSSAVALPSGKCPSVTATPTSRPTNCAAMNATADPGGTALGSTRWWLGADRADDVGVGLLVGRGADQGQAALGEDFEAEVATPVGPFVGLLGQDGADEADDGLAGGEDADDVGATAPKASVRRRISRLSRSLGLFASAMTGCAMSP